MLKLVPREIDRSQDYESLDKPATKETLLAQIAGGDQSAFGALYDEISPRVFGLIRRLLHCGSRTRAFLSACGAI